MPIRTPEPAPAPAVDATDPGLLCEKCRRAHMKPLHRSGRELGERFTSERLDRIVDATELRVPAGELREAALNWIEHHTDRKLKTRSLLESA